jgi:hypothetical protein
VRKHLNFGAVAVVCRSREGEYLGASALVVQGIADPGILEALACREALALAPCHWIVCRLHPIACR